MAAACPSKWAGACMACALSHSSQSGLSSSACFRQPLFVHTPCFLPADPHPLELPLGSVVEWTSQKMHAHPL